MYKKFYGAEYYEYSETADVPSNQLRVLHHFVGLNFMVQLNGREYAMGPLTILAYCEKGYDIVIDSAELKEELKAAKKEQIKRIEGEPRRQQNMLPAAQLEVLKKHLKDQVLPDWIGE